jgi:membrane protease YdiL (CAAX protease family)
LNSPEIEPAFEDANEESEEIARRPATIAPAWHTVVLVVFILAISIAGAYRNAGARGAVRVHKLETYAVTAALEAAIVGWVAFGLRLRKIPLRSLFGAISGDIRSIALDAVIAIVFWIGSMMALGTVALFWLGIETAITHRPLPVQTGKVFTPDPSQEHAVHAVLRLAPSNGREIAGWILLCLLVSVAEELVFRGYLQKQFTAWARGAVAAGVVFSAITFGAAHGYEGIRSMFLLALFGALFSLLALFRRSLRAGIFAHGWHDVFAGLMVSFLHARHLL